MTNSPAPNESGKVVMDSTAILALAQNEEGAERVLELIPASVISAANWSEVRQKLAQHGLNVEEASEIVWGLGLDVEPLTIEDAEAAATLWGVVSNLSLGDRCCMALGLRLGLPVVTSDRPWNDDAVHAQGILVEVFR